MRWAIYSLHYSWANYNRFNAFQEKGTWEFQPFKFLVEIHIRRGFEKDPFPKVSEILVSKTATKLLFCRHQSITINDYRF